jgi:hypothetical protein
VLTRRVCPRRGAVAFVIDGADAYHCGATMLPDPRLGERDPAELREYNRLRQAHRRRILREAGVL